MRYVRYNGKSEQQVNCTEPTCLRLGDVYEIVEVKTSQFQTNYVLKGFFGEYNSAWFDEITNVKFVLAEYMPVVGQRLRIYQLSGVDIITAIPVVKLTSVVEQVIQVLPNSYLVKTHNSLYQVQVV